MTAEPQPTAASNMSCRVTKEDDAAGVGDTRATGARAARPRANRVDAALSQGAGEGLLKFVMEPVGTVTVQERQLGWEGMVKFAAWGH
jgi:hypothetical protein